MKKLIRNAIRFLKCMHTKLVFFERSGIVGEKKLDDDIAFISIRDERQFACFVARYNYSKNNYLPGRFDKGDVFCALVNDSECLSSGWVATNRLFYISEINLKVLIGPNVCILYDFYTESQHRGKGFYPFLLQSIMNGDKRYIIYVLKSNVSSLKGVEKASFSKLFYAGVFSKKTISKCLK